MGPAAVNDVGLGQGNLDKITIQGASLNDHIITYKLHRTVNRQMEWDIPIDWNLIHPSD